MICIMGGGGGGKPRPVWPEICPIMPNHLNILLKTQILGALLVASGLLNSYKKFHQDWTKNWHVIL